MSEIAILLLLLFINQTVAISCYACGTKGNDYLCKDLRDLGNRTDCGPEGNVAFKGFLQNPVMAVSVSY